LATSSEEENPMSTRDGSIGTPGATRGVKRLEAMGRSLMLACLALGPVLGIARTAHGDDDLRLGDRVVPTFQAIRLVVDASKPSYSGSVHVSLQVKQPTTHFRFHAQDLQIGKLGLRRSGAQA